MRRQLVPGLSTKRPLANAGKGTAKALPYNLAQPRMQRVDAIEKRPDSGCLDREIAVLKIDSEVFRHLCESPHPLGNQIQGDGIGIEFGLPNLMPLVYRPGRHPRTIKCFTKFAQCTDVNRLFRLDALLQVPQFSSRTPDAVGEVCLVDWHDFPVDAAKQYLR
jgi:hypothetical protein